MRPACHSAKPTMTRRSGFRNGDILSIRLTHVALFAMLFASVGSASSAPVKSYVLIPYQEPDSTDPHAAAITQMLNKELTAAGVNTTLSAPIDHLAAVSSAATICAQNHATAILIPEGRYEQTMKRFSISFFLTVLRYPTHAEFRLDEIGCDGNMSWGTVTTGDRAPSGVDSVGNLGTAVDGAFGSAVHDAVRNFVGAPIPAEPSALVTPAVGPLPSGAITTYLLLPIRQPGIADPRADDITHSLLLKLQQRNFTVDLGTPIDHLSSVSGATGLCASAKAQAIVVPDVRIEQSSYTGHSYASMHLTLLNCNGAIIGRGEAQANMGSGFINNFGAAAVGVSERAMGPALDQLFPATNKGT